MKILSKTQIRTQFEQIYHEIMETGEPVTITHRGRPVLVMKPILSSELTSLTINKEAQIPNHYPFDLAL